MGNDYKAIKRIEEILIEKKIKNSDFQARLGISKQTWSNWKNRGLPPRMVFPVADLLGLNLDYLLNGTGEKYVMNVNDEPAWRSLAPEVISLVEDILQKVANNQLLPGDIQVLQHLVDALSKIDCQTTSKLDDWLTEVHKMR